MAFPDQLTKEVKEFTPLEAYHPHPHYYPHTIYTNNLFIYPLSLKYDTQKMFAKVSSAVNYDNTYTCTPVIWIGIVNIITTVTI